MEMVPAGSICDILESHVTNRRITPDRILINLKARYCFQVTLFSFRLSITFTPCLPAVFPKFEHNFHVVITIPHSFIKSRREKLKSDTLAGVLIVPGKIPQITLSFNSCCASTVLPHSRHERQVTIKKPEISLCTSKLRAHSIRYGSSPFSWSENRYGDYNMLRREPTEHHSSQLRDPPVPATTLRRLPPPSTTRICDVAKPQQNSQYDQNVHSK
jgi:hypothetical protein